MTSPKQIPQWVVEAANAISELDQEWASVYGVRPPTERIKAIIASHLPGSEWVDGLTEIRDMTWACSPTQMEYVIQRCHEIAVNLLPAPPKGEK